MKALNEFFWMWLASISPIIFGSLFIVLDKDISYIEIFIKTFFDGPVFAYVATMIAPFLYLIHLYIKKIREHDPLRYGGLAMVVSLVVVITTSGLMYKKQLSDYEAKEHFSIGSVQFQVDSAKDSSSIPSKEEQSGPLKEIVKGGFLLTNTECVAFLCYLLSLLIWFYSISLNQKEAPDLQENSRKKSKQHSETMNVMFDEFDKAAK